MPSSTSSSMLCASAAAAAAHPTRPRQVVACSSRTSLSRRRRWSSSSNNNNWRRVLRCNAAGSEEVSGGPSLKRSKGESLNAKDLLGDDDDDAMADRPSEKFMVIGSGQFECTGCGYIYDPKEGDPEYPVSPGTKFGELPGDWCCPVCGAGPSMFQSKAKVLAGFAENQGYGLGTNSMTSDQKSYLIWGSLLAFFALFLADPQGIEDEREPARVASMAAAARVHSRSLRSGIAAAAVLRIRGRRPSCSATPSPQEWNSQLYEQNARFVSDLGAPVLQLLRPRAGERILDLGCGDGDLTAKIASLAPESKVVGLDQSADLVATAQARGVDAHCSPAEELGDEDEYDAVFSNAALHWMDNDQVIPRVYRALRSPGRFVGEFGGFGNIISIQVAMQSVLRRRGIPWERVNPWYFPSSEAYRHKLERYGFQVVSSEIICRPTKLPGSVAEWIATFGGHYLSQAKSEQEKCEFVDEAVELLEPVLKDPHDGSWTMDYVRLRFHAVKAHEAGRDA